MMADTNRRGRSRILLLLHSHLPYVPASRQGLTLEETWLYQNLTECYLPLAMMLRELSASTTPFGVTVSLSPTLLSMTQNPGHIRGYRRYLDMLLRLLSAKTVMRDSDAAGARAHLERRVTEIRRRFDEIGGHIVDEWRSLARDPRITFITTCATHAILPAYRFSTSLVRLQVETGLRYFESALGFRPDGFWLPEMAYYEGLDSVLRKCGIRYTFLDTGGLYGAGLPPAHGCFQPYVTESELLLFPRDAELSGAIWSAREGYPGDFRYREFHYDYTWSLTESELAAENIGRMPAGLKLYRITGGDTPKQFYDPREAANAVTSHARDFIRRVSMRAASISEIAGITPLFTLPFDAELFGHWWYEGPEFLQSVIEAAAHSNIECVTPNFFTAEGTYSRLLPTESSWGRNGAFETWLNPECEPIYHRIADLYTRLIRTPSSGPMAKAQQCAFRELLLAQSSDWPFFIAWKTSADYGRLRLREHLDAAETILRGMEAGTINNAYLLERERRYPLFVGTPGKPPCESD